VRAGEETRGPPQRGETLRQASQEAHASAASAMNPELREGLDKLTPVVPGRRMLLKPPGFVMAQHVHAGHRLELRVMTSDPDKVPLFAVDPQVTVLTGPDATRLRLPVVGGRVYPDKTRVKMPA
jgi:X-Pro dipeptidyl-peptidase-like protein